MANQSLADNALVHLSDELNAFLDAYGYEHESADEVLHRLCDASPRNDLHIDYLMNFIARWDLAEQGVG